MKIIIICCLLSLIITSCGQIPGLQSPTPTPTPQPSPTPTCAAQSDEFLTQITGIETEWNDAVQLASNTSRIALSPAVANLQTLRRRADALQPPDCAHFAKYYLMKHMDFVIDGFLLFMADGSDEDMNAKFKDAGGALTSYQNEIELIISR